MIPKGKKFLDRYIVTGEGKVYSLNRNRFMKFDINNCGYERVELRVNHKPKKFFVHRLVAQMFIDNPNNLKVINHKDGNKLNNNVENLEWTTQSRNVLHAYETGLAYHHKGEDMYSSKLKETDVYRIFELRDKEKWTFQRIADKMNVTLSCVHSIYKRRTWKHLDIQKGSEHDI